MMISKAQEPIQTKYGTEYIAILPEHIRDIELDKARLENDEKILAARESQVQNLQAALASAKKVEDIDSKINIILHNIIDDKNLNIKYHDEYITHLEKVEASQPKKTFLDKFAFKLAIAGLGIAANSRTAFFPASPCNNPIITNH